MESDPPVQTLEQKPKVVRLKVPRLYFSSGRVMRISIFYGGLHLPGSLFWGLLMKESIFFAVTGVLIGLFYMIGGHLYFRFDRLELLRSFMLEKKKSTGDIKALLLYDVKDLDPYLSVSGFFLRRAAANPNSVWGIAYGIRFGLTAFTTFLFCLYGFLLFQDNYRGLPYLFLHFFAFIMAVIYVIDLDKNLPKNFKSHNPKLPAITENTDLERISHFVENDFYQGAWQRGTFGKSTLTGMSPAGSGDTVSPGTSNSLLLVPPINRPNWEEEKSSREGTEEGCSQRTSGRTSGERTSGESISNVEKESITNTKGGGFTRERV